MGQIDHANRTILRHLFSAENRDAQTAALECLTEVNGLDSKLCGVLLKVEKGVREVIFASSATYVS